MSGIVLHHILLIALGSALGGVARYLVSNCVHLWLNSGFPYGTLTVNLIGSFLIGILFTALLIKHTHLAPALRALLLVGFLGGFTTFSLFAIETFNLLESGALAAALMNVMANCVGCIVAAWAGIGLARQLM